MQQHGRDDLPEDDNCTGALAVLLGQRGGGNLLRGQISVGMFLSWRRRCEAVWAVQVNWHAVDAGRCNGPYRRAPPSGSGLAGGSSAYPPGCVTYRDRAAQLQRLAHEELRAPAHRHEAGRPHRHGPRDFEHGGGGGGGRVVVADSTKETQGERWTRLWLRLLGRGGVRCVV